MRTSIFITICCVVLVTLIILLYDIVFSRNFKRYTLYKQAKQKAEDTGKRLVVVGAPDTGGISGSISSALNLYGCGDVCIDIQGCKTCPSSITGKIEDAIPQLEDNSCVLFISCVLEYIEDLPAIIPHLERVSGGDLFVVHVDNLVFGTGTYFDRRKKSIFKQHWKITNAPPKTPFIEYSRAFSSTPDRTK
jgi:hypothetical protein